MKHKWKNLYNLVMKNNPNFNQKVLPFSDGYINSDYISVYRSIYNKEKYLND